MFQKWDITSESLVGLVSEFNELQKRRENGDTSVPPVIDVGCSHITYIKRIFIGGDSTSKTFATVVKSRDDMGKVHVSIPISKHQLAELVRNMRRVTPYVRA